MRRKTRVCLAGSLVPGSLILCGALMTFAAAAQTVPGAPKPLGQPSTNQTQQTVPPAPVSATCLRTNPFDTTSQEFVIKKVTAAGYLNVRGLYKGCDQIWRGHALQNGIDVAIMVTPTGQVLKAGY